MKKIKYFIKITAIMLVAVCGVLNAHSVYTDNLSLSSQTIFDPLDEMQIKDAAILRFFMISLSSSLSGVKNMYEDIGSVLGKEKIKVSINFSDDSGMYQEWVNEKAMIIPAVVQEREYYIYATFDGSDKLEKITIFTEMEVRKAKKLEYIKHMKRDKDTEKAISHNEKRASIEASYFIEEEIPEEPLPQDIGGVTKFLGSALRSAFELQGLIALAEKGGVDEIRDEINIYLNELDKPRGEGPESVLLKIDEMVKRIKDHNLRVKIFDNDLRKRINDKLREMLFYEDKTALIAMRILVNVPNSVKEDTKSLGILKAISQGLSRSSSLINAAQIGQMKLTARIRARQIVNRLINLSLNSNSEKILMVLDNDLVGKEELQKIFITLWNLYYKRRDLGKILSNVIIIRGQGTRLAEKVNERIKSEGIKTKNIIIIANEKSKRLFRDEILEEAVITLVDKTFVSEEEHYLPLAHILLFTLEKAIFLKTGENYDKKKLIKLFEEMNAEIDKGKKIEDRDVTIILKPVEKFDYDSELSDIYRIIIESIERSA